MSKGTRRYYFALETCRWPRSLWRDRIMWERYHGWEWSENEGVGLIDGCGKDTFCPVLATARTVRLQAQTKPDHRRKWLEQTVHRFWNI